MKQTLFMNQKLRASNKAYDKFKEASDPNRKKASFRETYMPTFTIHSCDHLGLLSTSFNRLLTMRNINKIKEVLAKNKEGSELD